MVGRTQAAHLQRNPREKLDFLFSPAPCRTGFLKEVFSLLVKEPRPLHSLWGCEGACRGSVVEFLPRPSSLPTVQLRVYLLYIGVL